MLNQYIIVIDFDETIGYFSELYKFWHYVKIYLNNELSYLYLYKILDKYNLFFRPGIFKIFKYIKNKKKNNICNKVIIYTNNKGSHDWLNIIVNYINIKLKYNLFDFIIQNIDNNKSYSVLNKLFINNTNTNLYICFIDNNLHNKMFHKNVLYINIKSYVYYPNYVEICKYFYNNNIDLFNNIIQTPLHFTNSILSNMQKYINNNITIDIQYNLLISIKIKNTIKIFLKNNTKTIKNKKKNKTKNKYKNKTKKNI